MTSCNPELKRDPMTGHTNRCFKPYSNKDVYEMSQAVERCVTSYLEQNPQSDRGFDISILYNAIARSVEFLRQGIEEFNPNASAMVRLLHSKDVENVVMRDMAMKYAIERF